MVVVQFSASTNQTLWFVPHTIKHALVRRERDKESGKRDSASTLCTPHTRKEFLTPRSGCARQQANMPQHARRER